MTEKKPDKQEKEWKKAESGQVFKFVKENDSVEGIYLGHEQSKMYPESFAVTLKRPDDTIVIVFVSNIIAELLKKNQIHINQKIKIVYLGKKKSETSGMEYNNYELYFM